MELERNQSQFEKAGFGLAAISYDSVAVLHAFAERKGIHIPLLSDPDSKLIRAVGILNEGVPKDDAFYGIPYPGTFVVDQDGKVVSKYFEEDFRQRYSAAGILIKEFGAPPQGSKSEVRGKQALVAVSASDNAVHAGERITLALDVDLKPGMHVYAPGVEGYIPVAWNIHPSDAWTAHDAVFPASEKLHLAAIDETVPVFQNHIRITRDLTIAPEAKLTPAVNAAGQLVVEGTFRYQACDDRMCYIPETLPVKWTFEVAHQDRTRVPAELQKKRP